MQHTKLLFLLCLTAITLTANAVDPAFTHRITLEIQQNDEYLGNLTLGLFGSVVPKTVMNFYQLSETHYTNTTFHRVIDGFMIQGGDFENHDGTGGYSIYGKSQGSLPDENFTLKHDRVGRLSMANSGPNTAGSQFFITSAPAEFLDGKHVVFGQLIDGFETLGAIQRVAKDIEDRPLTNVTISSVRREVMDDQMDDYTETAKHQNSTPTEGLENTESSQDLKPVLEEKPWRDKV
ncbi:hypothetical protein KL921_001271 [Ogataea angusta]|uniref:Peptidyl-prolyl cis-trans isomerase n=1 Tax=Pichia angusta TaxID=870730 RepID=A0ABQ7S2Z5_PICAN|nr:hypothetical protein KL921_001271 [Ogataea angusta]KAG7832305.1 hypothetical protein KL920_000640 [Ogataea angusta]KAG7843545.1 hypothetical protein KL942_000641 [Ogataea angusta]KAG7851761.1 hypothetical protein KL941_001430 [Ogataea angusta]KAG7852302.1 hypothetical protein KL940_000003 [Ogataea angusta]